MGSILFNFVLSPVAQYLARERKRLQQTRTYPVTVGNKDNGNPSCRGQHYKSEDWDVPTLKRDSISRLQCPEEAQTNTSPGETYNSYAYQEDENYNNKVNITVAVITNSFVNCMSEQNCVVKVETQAESIN
jgi:hypothetical protein